MYIYIYIYILYCKDIVKPYYIKGIQFRDSHLHMLYKIEKFEKLTGKHLCWSNSLIKRLHQKKCFPIYI